MHLNACYCFAISVWSVRKPDTIVIDRKAHRIGVPDSGNAMCGQYRNTHALSVGTMSTAPLYHTPQVYA